MAVMDTLRWLGESLDKPGAAVRGLLSGRPDQLANLIPFSDTMGITDPRERVGGRQLLEEWGALGQNTPGLDFGDVLGFGAEMALDPLNLIGAGLLGRTARAGGMARRANQTIDAQNAAIQAANQTSEAMRAAGALPEELLPQAVRFYDYIPNVKAVQDSPTMRKRLQFPGKMGIEGSKNYTRFSEHLDDVRDKHLSDMLRLRNSGNSFWPELFPLKGEDLDDVGRDILEIASDAGARPFRFGGADPSPFDFPPGVHLESGGLPNALEAATAHGVNMLEEINQLDPYGFSGDSALYPIQNFREMIRKIDDENLNLIASTHGGEFNTTAMNPGDHVLDILKDPTDVLYPRLRAPLEFEQIANELASNVSKAVHPAPEASRSFYAVQNPKFIDDDIYGVLTSPEFPATKLESLEKAMEALFVPESELDSLLGDVTSAIKAGSWANKEDLAGRFMDQILSGKRIPNIYEDVFSSGETFLPYVAPAIREALPLQQVPRIDRRAIMALLGHNALAQGGRSGTF